nr:protein kinase [Verrucomicrobium spinosum]
MAKPCLLTRWVALPALPHGCGNAAHAGEDDLAAVPPPKPEDLAPHFPQLEIIECLGRGGMGVVYKARQKSLNRLVALKLLAPERAGDAQFSAHFEKEARALAALNHPHIVDVYDFGESGGYYYLLMEFVDGVNLRQLLQTKRLTPEEALTIVPPVCDALQCAHDHHIVHCDIKPENVLVNKAGVVKIADFGIARIVEPRLGCLRRLLVARVWRARRTTQLRSRPLEEPITEPTSTAWAWCFTRCSQVSGPRERLKLPPGMCRWISALMRSCCGRWRNSPNCASPRLARCGRPLRP